MSGNLSNQTSDSTGFKRGGIGADYRYEAETAEPPSVAVSRALAEVRGESPCSSTPQLYEYIDPDALESLIASRQSRDGSTVTFRYDSHWVTVEGSGTITIESID